MVDRAMSAKRILDFAVMKTSPDKTPSKLKSGHQKLSSSPATMKAGFSKRSPSDIGLLRPNTGGNGNSLEFSESPARSVNRIVSPRRNQAKPGRELYLTPSTSPNSLYQRLEPEGFEEVIRKAAKVVAKKENINVELDSSYITNSVSVSAIAASQGGANWMQSLGLAAACSFINGVYAYMFGDRLDRMMEKGFGPELDAFLLKCLREAAYECNWVDLLELARGDVSNNETVLAFKSALVRFIQGLLFKPPYLHSPEIDIVRAAL